MRSPTWQSWVGMKNRCLNPNQGRYKDYGGRGIKICDRWRLSFSAFLEDMGPRPDGLTLDRIDNDGNYEPGNCRWATRKAQARNARTVPKITIDGIKRPVPDVAVENGIKLSTVNMRIRRGWAPHRAATTPVEGRR